MGKSDFSDSSKDRDTVLNTAKITHFSFGPVFLIFIQFYSFYFTGW